MDPSGPTISWTRVGEDDGGSGDARIFPEHPGLILPEPEENISRKGIPPLIRISFQVGAEVRPRLPLH